MKTKIEKLKDKMNDYLTAQNSSYTVEVLIPLTKNWAYYRDNDNWILNREWLVHLSCPRQKYRIFCWTNNDKGCSECETRPSRVALRKKEILSKIQNQNYGGR